METMANGCQAILIFPDASVISETIEGSFISGEVPDATLTAIHRFYDFVEQGADYVDRLLSRGKDTLSGQVGKKTVSKKPTDSSQRKITQIARASTAASCKAHAYIVERVTSSGVTEFVVKSDGQARAQCSTRKQAEDFLRVLEKNS